MSKLISLLLPHVGKLVWMALLLAIAVCLAWVVFDEYQSSRRQARYLAESARSLTFHVEPGSSSSIRFPKNGPIDERLGYSRLPAFLERLSARKYSIVDQAHLSPHMMKLSDVGLFPIYHEKDQAGLDLLDCNGRPFYSIRYPQRLYRNFESIPPLLVNSLVFIEDHELLDATHPTRNPAIDWKRFTKAVLNQVRHVVDPDNETPGGSTLATQIEKYRHSPEGRTASGIDKLRQMASASLRAYLDGENTLPARRQIVLRYLNTVPLAARSGHGEINGLGDGLWAWYGRDFAEANALLQAPNPTPGDRTDVIKRRAEVFKQALSLIVAQRRPSYYLGEGQRDLYALTDSYLRLLGAAGVIPSTLRDAALGVKLTLHKASERQRPVSFVSRKAANAWRTHLADLLGMPRLYDLDRLDVMAGTTLNSELQRTVTEILRKLGDPAAAKAQGLYGFRMLRPGDDPSKIAFSFTLLERGEHANLVRVQADNLDQPFDINEGSKLNLGSTAKLRTLITYLEIVAGLHHKYADKSKKELAAVPVDPKNALARWALDYLGTAKDRRLPAMLEGAMERRYSANPGEAFFTGSGMQSFENFDPEENHRKYSVRQAFQKSVNLVFVRLMRDIVRHYIYQAPGSTAQLLKDADDPRRREYLSRFADNEGRAFIYRFYKKYQGRTAPQMQEILLQSVHPVPRRLATVFRSIEPQATLDQFSAFLRQQLAGANLPESELRNLYEKFGPKQFSLADRGYIAGVHPLELWLVGFLRHNPGATRMQIIQASGNERQAVYAWLFNTRHKNAQDNRIQSLLELEAFLEIARDWRRLGYPFEALTPSYASAIGASGDRPAALAELVGIILNKGVRLPIEKIETLRFAAATPYETRLKYQAAKAERLLAEEITKVVHRALVDVVDGGTAARIAGRLVMKDGTLLEVGGKTGTGDHRYEVYGRGGRTIAERVINRSATFVFFIGDRYFGTITAYAHEPYAARYKFTSAMSVQLLKSLAPVLTPLFERDAVEKLTACRPDYVAKITSVRSVQK
ncbi:Membrane carboxypeptidase (Penicillin-binding protein) [Georgfuchsia toluolica]|uniref:peptidoglycan glycosyltransferase n=1 Tax=Georgfuchsia toluolica TaxID=424218 RepID=A0A916N1L6_9PROT|nr:transglycosylase domain-containing protein [Georgfuchsia toluolica]CAG4885070.1 Membrane carboxypeptidase (Penicillin-binding protein) [Georgfuchsia toluolica]